MAKKKDRDLLAEAKAAFKLAEDAEIDNREEALDDLRFARLGEQWPEAIIKQRKIEGRPYLTINRLPAFIRQVVNDARQNKPGVKIHAMDDQSDYETAQVITGLIRHVEAQSNADVAYDTAIENAVSGGFGYWRIGIDYARDDTFDLDIVISRVADPFTVYGDPHSTAADSSDWNSAFICDRMPKDEFERTWGKDGAVNWDSAAYSDLKGSTWAVDENTVLVAEWWRREEAVKTICRLSDGTVIDMARLKEKDFAAAMATKGLTVDPAVKPREVRSWKVTQTTMTGAEVLEEREWPGRYIPIVPVYGDEVNEQGKRHFRSLIRDAKDAQRMFNYWRTTSTELVALAPRVPFIGPVGSFTTDADKWATANTSSHAFMEYDEKGAPPQRQPIETGPATGAMSEALAASDDMKTVIGLQDASLGIAGNETSGKAIMARQREGDVSTFHFIDNLTRAVRHSGKILLDLIPHVYNKQRIIRIVGEDGSAETTTVNGPVPVMGKDGQPQMQAGKDGQAEAVKRVFDLTTGKYDLIAAAGPGYTTRREEAANQMTELIRANPAIFPVVGDLLVKNLDWPGADEIAERLKAMIPPGAGGLPPEVEQGIQEMKAAVEALTKENEALKADHAVQMAEVQIKGKEVEIKAFEAETDRMQAQTARTAAAPAEAIQMNNDAVAMAIQALAAALQAPKQVLRGPDGRVMGIVPSQGVVPNPGMVN